MKTPTIINKRYAGSYRLITFLKVVSYLVLASGVLSFAGHIYTALSSSMENNSLFIFSALTGLVVSLVAAILLQGCSSVLKAVTDTAVVTLGGEVPD